MAEILQPIKNMEYDEVTLARAKNIYFVGIGGIGMTGLAFLLKEKGCRVSGSDQKDGATVKMLREEGVKVYIGHNEENLPGDTQLVAYSSAVKDDNPELAKARALGIPILKRGQLLGYLSRDKKTIAVAGSHGKTTTTALIAYLMSSLGYEPGVCVGGVPLNYTRNAWWGNDYFVVETDESDGSFLWCAPWVSIITNVDQEHLDHYGTYEKLKQGFLQFARQTKEKVFGCGEDPVVRDILAETGGISYGWNKDNNVRAENFSFDGQYSCYDLYISGKFVSQVKTPLLGEHNVLNTLAAIAFFMHLGQDLDKVIELLKKFKGTKRRFQHKASVAGITFIDDYAHHPTEIRAVLKAAQSLGYKRVVAVFQPHRYSRVKALFEEFAKSFVSADMVVITDIYAASEPPLEGVSSQVLFELIKKNFSGKAVYVPKDKLAGRLPDYLESGDICVSLGAGDVNLMVDEAAAGLHQQTQERAG